MNKPTKVFFFHGAEKDTMTQSCQKFCQDINNTLRLPHLVYDGCVKGISSKDIHAQDYANVYPIIYLSAHGSINFGHLALDNIFFPPAVVTSSATTFKPAHVEIFSCYSGAAKNDADGLSFGSSLVTHSSDNKPTLIATINEELRLSFGEFNENPFINYIMTILLSAEQTNSLSIRTSSGVKTFAITWPTNICNKRDFTSWQKSKILELKAFYEDVAKKGLPTEIKNYVQQAIEFIEQKSEEIDQIQQKYFYRTLELNLFNGIDDNNIEKVNCLMEIGVSPNAQINNIKPDILQNEQRMDLSMIDKWSLDMSNSNFDGNFSPLELAIKNNRLVITKILLKAGADPNYVSYGWQSPIATAVVKENLAALKLLVDFGANVKKPTIGELVVIHGSICKQWAEILKTLIKAGLDVDNAMFNGVSPLSAAVIHGAITSTTILIEDGKADVNKAAQDNGVTPLYIAVVTGDIAIVKYLIKVGADVNKSAHNGVSPAYEAVFYGHLEILKILKDAGADLNQARNDGITPLHVAADKGNTAVVELIVSVVADPNKPSDNDGSPLAIACMRGHTEVVKLLLPYSNLDNDPKAFACLKANMSTVLDDPMPGQCPAIIDQDCIEL